MVLKDIYWINIKYFNCPYYSILDADQNCMPVRSLDHSA